jgi:hypothetical protein
MLKLNLELFFLIFQFVGGFTDEEGVVEYARKRLGPLASLGLQKFLQQIAAEWLMLASSVVHVIKSILQIIGVPLAQSKQVAVVKIVLLIIVKECPPGDHEVEQGAKRPHIE